MTREQLKEASNDLREAAEASDNEDLQERIHTQSDQLAELAEADKGPDHGRLARHMNVLAEIAGEATDKVKQKVKAARDKVAEYRSGVEGV